MNLQVISSLDSYSDDVGINLSRKNFPYFLTTLFHLLGHQFQHVSFFYSSFLRDLLILKNFTCHYPFWNSKRTPNPRGNNNFDRSISSDLLPFNDPEISSHLHDSSGSHFSLVISFAPLSLALSCAWELL